MNALAGLLPILAVLGLLASGRVSGLVAGAVGAAVTVATTPWLLPADADVARFLAVEAGRGGWIAWLAILVIAAGILLQRAVETARADAPEPTADYPSLTTLCLYAGPFTECVTGFGVGQIVIHATIARMGVSGLAAGVLPLFSLSLIPWGAMAVGTQIGATLADLDADRLGFWCAVATAPILLASVPVFRRMARLAGVAPTVGAAVDLAWMAGFAVTLVAASVVLPVDIAALSAVGLVLVLRVMRAGRDGVGILRAVGAPFLALAAILLLVRLAAGAGLSIDRVVEIRAHDDLPVWRPLSHPGTWSLIVALATLLLVGQARAIGHVLRAGGAAAVKPVLAILLFVLMGNWLAAAGVGVALAEAARGALGLAAPLVTPVIAAFGGFLTGSNSAANAMTMGLQAALGLSSGLAPYALPTIQNTVGAALAGFAPGRITVASALTGGRVSEPELWRAVRPLVAAPLVVGLGATLALVLARWLP